MQIAERKFVLYYSNNDVTFGENLQKVMYKHLYCLSVYYTAYHLKLFQLVENNNSNQTNEPHLELKIPVTYFP